MHARHRSDVQPVQALRGSRLTAFARRWNDQGRLAGVLGNLMGDAALEALSYPGQAVGADHDYRGIDLVGDVQDALPGHRRDLAPGLGREAGSACEAYTFGCAYERVCG